MPTWLTNWLPPLSIIVVVALLFVISGWIFNRRSGARGPAFQRQALGALLVFVGVLAVVITLPIADVTRGNLLNLIGLLLSAAIALSSATFVSNMMAGILLKVLKNFRLGDFIAVEEYFGRVSEQGLLHAEIQTEDRDLITLPNLYLATHPVRVTRTSGTVVSAEVSLGYDLPRRKIQTSLLAAAESAGLSEPFVRVLELGDFSVSYRVAGILTEVKQLLSARSVLRAAILDHLHNDGIEIVSPNFMNQRVLSPQQIFIPTEDPSSSDDGEEIDVFPEEIIFDKAEEAESLERLKSARASLEDRVSDLKASLKEAEDDGQRASIEKRLQRAEGVLERFTRKIEGAEKP